MRKIDLFIFDLDGTLIDSKRDIAASVHFTLNKLGLPPLPDETIYSFVGNGVIPLIERSVGSKVNFQKALTIFKDHYDQHLLDTTKLFADIHKVLDHFLKKPKVIVTNKSQGYSEKILRGLKIDHYFKGVYGGDTSFPKKPEPEVIHHILKMFKMGPEASVIIGDSRVDLETGRNAGILTCGVTWGYRPREELEEIGCDYLIERPEKLMRLFM